MEGHAGAFKIMARNLTLLASEVRAFNSLPLTSRDTLRSPDLAIWGRHSEYCKKGRSTVILVLDGVADPF